MHAIEQNILSYLRRRHADGALSATAEEILRAILPADQVQLRSKPSYKNALERLHRRRAINAVDAPDGTRHYFLGDFPSPELRESLGI